MPDLIAFTLALCAAYFDPIAVKGGGSITSYTIVETGERTRVNNPGSCRVVEAENGALRDAESNDQ